MSTDYIQHGNSQIRSLNGNNLFITINFIVLGEFISVFGIITNVINLIVFCRQGLNTTTNISFFAMAVSDLCSLVSQLVFNIYFQPLCKDICVHVVYIDFQYLTGGIPHEIFARITSFITVYITAERCLCVLFPLHIKQMITRKKTTIAMVSIFGFALLCASPVYVTNQVGWKFDPEMNRSLLGIVPLPGNDILSATEYFLHAITGLFVFLAVVALTSLLMMTLKKKSHWRKTARVQKDKGGSMSSRDRKTTTMVVLVASVLIICYAPATLLAIVMVFEPGFIMGGKYHDLYFVSWSFVLLLENINASVNMFLYLKMNSKFRHQFHVTFCNRIRGNMSRG